MKTDFSKCENLHIKLEFLNNRNIIVSFQLLKKMYKFETSTSYSNTEMKIRVRISLITIKKSAGYVIFCQ